MSEVQKPTVLVVDDEPVVIRAHKRVLEREGYIVLTADHRNDALKLLSDKLDACVCDMEMPEFSGKDMYEAAKKIGTGLQDRIVFVTGGSVVKELQAFIAERRVAGRVLDKAGGGDDVVELRRLVVEAIAQKRNQATIVLTSNQTDIPNTTGVIGPMYPPVETNGPSPSLLGGRPTMQSEPKKDEK